jgi:predicted PurR-regulated permease PerM
MIRFGWYTAIVLATLTALVLLWQFSLAVALFALSLAVAAAIRPLSENLSRGGLPRSMALFLSYALVVIVLGGLVSVVIKPLLSDARQGIDSLLTGYDRVKIHWQYADDQHLQGIAEQLPATEALFSAFTAEQSDDTVLAMFGVASDVSGYLSMLAIIIVLSMYWSTDQVRFERLWLSLLPHEQRFRSRNIWRDIEQGVGSYLRSEVLLSLLAGIMLWVGYWALGLKYVVLFAVLGALARLIPWLGDVFVLIILPCLAGLSGGLWVGIEAVIYTILILFILEAVVKPKIFSRQHYSSLLMLIVLVAMFDSFGLIGALLAPPVAVAIQILFTHLFSSRVSNGTNTSQENEIVHLKERLVGIKEKGASLPPETSNLVDRLEKLMDKTS